MLHVRLFLPRGMHLPKPESVWARKPGEPLLVHVFTSMLAKLIQGVKYVCCHEQLNDGDHHSDWGELCFQAGVLPNYPPPPHTHTHILELKLQWLSSAYIQLSYPSPQIYPHTDPCVCARRSWIIHHAVPWQRRSSGDQNLQVSSAHFPRSSSRLHKCSHSYRNGTGAEIIQHPNMWVQMLRPTPVLSPGTVYSPACSKEIDLFAGFCSHKFHATSCDPFPLPIASHSYVLNALCHHLYGNGSFFSRALSDAAEDARETLVLSPSFRSQHCSPGLHTVGYLWYHTVLQAPPALIWEICCLPPCRVFFLIICISIADVSHCGLHTDNACQAHGTNSDWETLPLLVLSHRLWIEVLNYRG